MHQFCIHILGFTRLHGYPVGIIANNGILSSDSALKVRTYLILITVNLAFDYEAFCISTLQPLSVLGPIICI